MRSSIFSRFAMSVGDAWGWRNGIGCVRCLGAPHAAAIFLRGRVSGERTRLACWSRRRICLASKAQLHTSLGQRPTAIKLSLESLVTRARSQAPAWECSILRGSSLLPDLQKHSAPEGNGRLEPPRQGRSQAGAWERDREFLNLMAVGQRPRTSDCEVFSAESAFHRPRGMERAFSAIPLWIKDLGRCPRLLCGRAFGAET